MNQPLLRPDPMSPSVSPARSEIAKAITSLRHAWITLVIFSMVANVMMLAPTLYMLQIYDRVLASQNMLTLLVVSLITLFFFSLMAFAEWARPWLLVRTGVRLDRMLRQRVFTASFVRGVAGASAQRAQPFADLTELRTFLTGPSIFAFFDLPWAPVYIAALFMLHPLLGGVALGFALIQAALAWFGHHRTVAPLEALAATQTKEYAYLHGKLRNAEAIEAMGMLQYLRHRWQSLHARHVGQHALALAIGALLVIDGQLTVGAMIATNVLMARALAPIDQLVGTWRGFVGARAAYRRLRQLLAEHPPLPAASKPARLKGNVQLRGLQATAPGRTVPILQHIDMCASPGTLTVVLGPSGSGKSTLARVLVAAWPACGGELLLDGRPITDWNQQTLGPQVGYLPQDTALFGGSIAENIARFAQVDPAKVIAAARHAGPHELVLGFPKGYDTLIGEAGRLLSGRQRQRIGLARALYGDPALLVFDEPNAHLDEIGEAALLTAISGLKARGKTILMVTHRAGVLAQADQVLVMRAGRIHLQGPRDQVFAQMNAEREDDPPPAANALPALLPA